MISYNKANSISNFKLLLCTIFCLSFMSFSVVFPEKYIVIFTKIHYYSNFVQQLVFKVIPSYIQNSRSTSEQLNDLKKENNRLSKVIQDLYSTKIMFTELKKENEELRSVLNVKYLPNIQNITTSLVKYEDILTTKNFNSKIILSVGSLDNIKTKSLIVTSDCVVGYITKVYSNKSVVKTLLDSEFKLSAFTEKSNYNVIVSGNGTNNPDVLIYSENYNFQENELLSTSGIEGLFPRNIPIGTLFKDPNTKTWKVNLLCNFSTLNYIFIVQ